MPQNLSQLLKSATGFDWDEANIKKIEDRHKVTIQEVEQVFTCNPFVVMRDPKHSQTEERYGILGVTHQKRKLAVYFTLRNNKIRPISARGFHQKELLKYKKRNEGVWLKN